MQSRDDWKSSMRVNQQVSLPYFVGRLHCLVIALLSFCFVVNAQADEVAQSLYADYSDSVVKIEVITPGLDNKSSLGTGFVIGRGDTDRGDIVASNFHVIADAVHEPDQHSLEWQNAKGERGPLRVIAVDVVHDLSILKAESNLGEPFTTATLPEKGTALYSMGHPQGLDLSIVPGTANGLLENSVYEKIHFSGGINSGMSGGPTLNASGEVVGINVASAGNSVGFLVPVHFLNELQEQTQRNNYEPVEDIKEQIGQQLHKSQNALINEFLNNEWPTQQVGSLTVPGAISDRLNCWGNNAPEKDDRKYREIASMCSGDDAIFLSRRQRAGIVSYEFFWIDSQALSNRAFYHMYEDRFNSVFWPGATEEDVGNFSCSTKFVELSGQSFKANICARPYKQYAGLVDFMVLMGMVGRENEGFIFTLDLATVTLENGMTLLQSFLEQFSWQP